MPIGPIGNRHCGATDNHEGSFRRKRKDADRRRRDGAEIRSAALRPSWNSSGAGLPHPSQADTPGDSQGGIAWA